MKINKRYIRRMLMRIFFLAMLGVTGKWLAFGAIYVPVDILHSLGVLPRIDLGNNKLVWAATILCGLWAMAHSLEPVVKYSDREED